jgi:hypothetical protein
MAAPAIADLTIIRERSELPSTVISPRFIFRKYREELHPKHFRMLCPVCLHWKEFDQLRFMSSFFDGVIELDETNDIDRESNKHEREFVERHLQCLMGPSANEGSLVCLYDSDERYHTLDNSMEENY